MNNEWEEITLEQADELLDCIKPAKICNGAFMMGKPLCNNGQTVYLTVVRINKCYYKKPQTINSFNIENYRKEIDQQLMRELTLAS